MTLDSHWPPNIGDRVTHFKNPGRVGTVMDVECDQSSGDYVVHVGYTLDGPWIPYYFGLKIVDASSPCDPDRPGGNCT
jgi:hypothetical protein